MIDVLVCTCPPGDRDLACPWHADWNDLTSDGKRFRVIAREGNPYVDPWSYVPCARSHELGDRVCIRENGHAHAHVVARDPARLGLLAGNATRPRRRTSPARRPTRASSAPRRSSPSGTSPCPTGGAWRSPSTC